MDTRSPIEMHKMIFTTERNVIADEDVDFIRDIMD